VRSWRENISMASVSTSDGAEAPPFMASEVVSELPRKDLQKLAKQLGIKANQKVWVGGHCIRVARVDFLSFR
jgi:hypothetical protein